HLRLARERGMAAGEQQLEPLIRDRALVQFVLHGLRRVKQVGLRRQRAVTPKPVDRAIARGRDQPRARVGWDDAVSAPALSGDRKGLLSGFLGAVEVAEETNQGGEHPPPLVAKGLLDQLWASTTGRISTEPPIHVAGTCDATSIARSMLSAS